MNCHLPILYGDLVILGMDGSESHLKGHCGDCSRHLSKKIHHICGAGCVSLVEFIEVGSSKFIKELFDSVDSEKKI